MRKEELQRKLLIILLTGIIFFLMWLISLYSEPPKHEEFSGVTSAITGNQVITKRQRSKFVKQQNKKNVKVHGVSTGTDRFQYILDHYSSDEEDDVCYDVTPQLIKDEYPLQIIKYAKSKASFIFYDDVVYEIGEWFGGAGLISSIITDMNKDGYPEIFCTYTYGKDVKRSEVLYFDTLKKETVKLNWHYEGIELGLAFDKDGFLCIYEAAVEGYSAVQYAYTLGHCVAYIEFKDKYEIVTRG